MYPTNSPVPRPTCPPPCIPIYGCRNTESISIAASADLLRSVRPISKRGHVILCGVSREKTGQAWVTACQITLSATGISTDVAAPKATDYWYCRYRTNRQAATPESRHLIPLSPRPMKVTCTAREGDSWCVWQKT